MSFLSFLGAAERQINPFDNNATAKNKKGNGQKKSTVQQVGETGFGFLKGMANIPIQAALNFTQAAGNLGTKAAGGKEQSAEQFYNQPGLKQVQKFSGSTGTGRQMVKNAAEVGLSAVAPAVGKFLGGAVAEGATKYGLSFLADAAEAGAKPVLTTAGKIVTGAAEGAALGAPFGAAATIGDSEPLTVGRIAKSALVGAGAGALLGGITVGGSEALGAVRARTELGIHEGLIKNSEEYRQLNEQQKTATPDTLPHIDARMKELRQSALQAGSLRKDALMPESTDPIKSPELRQYYEAKIAELKSMDGHQVDLIDSANFDGLSEGAKRVSNNSPVYSELYKKNGHPPTNQDYVDYIHEQNMADKPVGYADMGEVDYYKNLIGETKPIDAPQVGKTVDTSKPPSTIPAGERQKGFVDTLQKSENTDAIAKERLAKIDQTYKQASNQEHYDNAKKAVASDPQKVALDTLNTTSLDAQQSANGLELLTHLQKVGDYDRFIQVADHLDKSFRAHGQAVQMAALYDRMTPEGWLKTAAKKVQRAREQIGNYEFEGSTVADIKGQVEGIKPEDTGTVKKAVNKSIQDTIDKGLAEAEGTATTGEKVAKSVDKKLNPKVKKQADVLVKEIVKKIEQEELPAPGAKAKKSPLDTLREVFGRNDEAQAAYPEAQMILFEKYADNPEMMATLNKFFESELKLPAANSTIDAAIAEQLRAKKTTVSKAIYESWANQKQTVQDVTDTLVSQGFDEASAKTLATEVTGRLNKQFAEAKTATLQRLSQDAPKKAQKTFLDKIEKLSNVGALDGKDYIDLARAKLKLPNLTAESSARIEQLAQDIQGLPDGYEKFQLIDKLQEEIKSNVPETWKQKLVQVFGAPKSIMASGDLSGLLRQGGVLGSRFGKEWSVAAKDAIGYLGSKEKFDMSMSEIATRPNIDLYGKAGLDLAIPGGIREEAFPSGLAEKLPGLGKIVGASDRGYTGFLTKLRADVFDKIVADLESTGIDVRSMSEREIKDIGRFINTASGRGELGILEKHSVSLGEALFSPRLWKSRLDMLNPKYYYDLKGPARKYALQSAASFASIAASVLGLATLAGAKVETDARSSDFLKIKAGDTRYDILGGFQQNIVFAHRELVGEKKSSTTGAVTKLDSGGIGSANRLSILTDLIKSKENPVISTGANIIKGTDSAGNKLNPLSEVGKLLVPLPITDTYKSLQDTKNIPLSLVKATIPTVGGVGVNTYGVKDVRPTPKQQLYLDKLKAGGASKEQVAAAKLFYQTKKSAPQRAAANDAVNKAIEAGDMQKAQKLAQDYNKAYASAFTDWAKKYAGKYSSSKLNKEYSAGKIKLTGASIKSRVKTIKENKKA